ncbi:hypothetical protein FHT78_002407 [Rhizobium sp. BK196]|jgi:hypothetical protein|uniref:hypothetical protein n=1 Tax=Rhizobium sp. BK196 TaxID=2587073 RepID=UPI00161C7071|nr:hypothetical protein [Rhizobium sp. BK196]MBB3310663.1 hypothetical protein [Rhizobium sp. BK196]
MSRLTDTPAKTDLLQRSESACAGPADPSHPLFAGLVAVAPRLGAVMAFAGLVQISFQLISQ